MTNTAWLSRVLRWVCTVFAIACVAVAVAIVVVMLVDPSLPPGAHFGPIHEQFAGQPSTITLSNSTLTITALRGNLVLRVARSDGVIEVLKQHGLPLLLLKVLFFALVFDLLRRLFRNVGRDESFTRQSIRLVQLIGISLVGYSFAATFLEGQFLHALLLQLAQQATVTISGTPLHLPPPEGYSFAFGGQVFFFGLLVLALSEVFRQGLVLKRDSDLTI